MITIIDYGLGNICAFINVYTSLNIKTKIARSTNDLTNVSKIILPGVGSFDYAMQKLDESGMKKTLIDLAVNGHVPVLGVCVGMQMLADSSEEGKLPGLGWIKGRVKRLKNTEGKKVISAWKENLEDKRGKIKDKKEEAEVWGAEGNSKILECGNTGIENAKISEELEIGNYELEPINQELRTTNQKLSLPLPHMGWNNISIKIKDKIFKNFESGSRFYFLHSYYFEPTNLSDVMATTDYGIPFASAVGYKNIFGVQFHPEKSHSWGIQLLKNFAELA